MKKKIIKRLAIVFAAVVVLGGAVAVAFATGLIGVGEEPVLDIKGTNLSFSDSVYIKYAVSCKNADIEDVKLLIWTTPQSEYVKGTETAVLDRSENETDTVDGVECIVFNFKDIAAKQMTDNIYARAYVKVGGKEFYSETKKYSVLQYAYNKMGKTGTKTENQKLITLLEDMLAYGALAQQYTDYKTDTLATDNFSQIKLSGGVLSDNFNHGLYKVGTTVTISASKILDGLTFVCWKNSKGEVIATTTSVDVTVGESNEKYTAIYRGAIGNNLEYCLNDDGNGYTVCGIGSSTAKDVVIPMFISFKPVTAIADGAFKGNSSIRSISISKNITSIGAEAFSGCSSVTTIYFAGTKYGWTNIPKGDNWNSGMNKFRVDYADGSDEWELGGVPLD